MKNSFEGGERQRESHESWPHHVEVIKLQGGRPEQQDDYRIARIRTFGRDLLGVVVADGHGAQGKDAAREAVSQILAQVEKTKVLDEESLKRAFKDIHDAFVQENLEGGTTATTVFVEKNVATLAWVGNSQARVFSIDGTLHTLTLPHEYGLHPSETKRLDEGRIRIRPFNVRSEGGYGMAPQPSPKCGYIQTSGGLIEVSRALGDSDMDPVVLHEPEVKQVVFSPEERFLLVATDGLWNKLERKAMRQKIEQLLAQAPNARMAQFLLEGQLRKWKLKDNTTVVIVELHA